MWKYLIFLIITASCVTVLAVVRTENRSRPNAARNTNSAAQNTNTVQEMNATVNTALQNVTLPIADFFQRVTKKPFGLYVTPNTSPIQPERFTGYHTGADAETTPAEQQTDVPVYAIADCTVLSLEHVNGYGGFLALRCSVENTIVIAVYGHIRLASATVKKDDAVRAGEQLAVLGTGYSAETDGERKHLHFGILQEDKLDYRGYVQTAPGLAPWTDPVAWLKAHGA